MDRYKAEKLYHMIHYFAKWYAPAYYTVPEAARLLRVTQEDIKNYITSGEMKAVKYDGNYRISVNDLKNFLITKSEGQLSEDERRYDVYVV
jgi:excisionase family DNA binding protein